MPRNHTSPEARRVVLTECHPDDYLTSQELAETLRVSDRLVRQWRHLGIGPAVTRVSPKKPVYRVGDVLAWLETQTKGGDAA